MGTCVYKMLDINR